MKLAVVGLGKLGVPLAAVLASVGHEVVGVDPFASATVEALNRREVATFHEPGLADLILSLPDRRLTATTLYERAAGADATLIVVPTPSLPDGRFDPGHVRSAILSISTRAQRGHLVMVCSTTQPGTMAQLVHEFRHAHLDFAYCPTLIALGSVIRDLRYPDLCLVGADDQRTAERAETILQSFVVGEPWPPMPLLSLVDAEIAKLAINAYLVTKVAFALSIMEGCEGTPGADAARVLGAVGLDSRIGPKFLAPGGPVGGPCLPRDTTALRAFLDDARTTYAAQGLALAAQEVNDVMACRIAQMVEDYQRIGILGMTYTTRTGYIDGSLGLTLRRLLDIESLMTHDPAFPFEGAQRVVDEADVLVIATPHPEYADLDYHGKPVVDVWGLLPDRPNVRRLGRWKLA